LLKISGESFCPENDRGVSMDSVNHLAAQIVDVAQSGVQIAVVMGGRQHPPRRAVQSGELLDSRSDGALYGYARDGH
jgi:uridylate kinase